MKIGIIFAMANEREAFEALKYDINHEVVLYECGIGKVNAATTVSSAILIDKCDFIINCGVAGGINGAKKNDVFYGVELKYSDVDLSCFTRYEIGQLPGMPTTYKAYPNNFSFSKASETNIASQDTFATNVQKDLFVTHYSDYKVVDMESCAIAQACYNLDTDFAVIRAISDLVFEEDNHLEYEEAEDLACVEAAAATLELINQL